MSILPYLLVMRLHTAAINARRRAQGWRYLAYSAAAGVLAGTMFTLGALLVLLLWVVGLWWLAVIFGTFMLIPVVAGPITRHVCVPLGRVRLAFWGGMWSRPGDDGEAYALCCAAWAFARRPTLRGESWLTAKRDARRPLGDAEVVATALAAFDPEATRGMLRSVPWLLEDHPAVRELAGEWLAVDAAARGAWHELAGERWYPATPLAFLLEGIAAHRLGLATAPGRAELFARWLVAPYRRATRALLPAAGAYGSAANAPRAATPTQTDPTAAAQLTAPEPFVGAVAAHVAFADGEPNATRLAEVVAAWDTALAAAATHELLARRAIALDAPLGAIDRVLRDIAAAVTDELARVAELARLAPPPGAARGPASIADALVRKLRHGRLDALEQAFSRWEQRRHDGAVRAPIDEWREFVALRGAYFDAATAGGLELRRLAFPHAFSTANHMAAWLWNTRSEYVISHAISRWLLDEALAVGDAEAIEFGYRNCALAIPTRLGAVHDPTVGEHRARERS